jgi:hypothetical protein
MKTLTVRNINPYPYLVLPLLMILALFNRAVAQPGTTDSSKAYQAMATAAFARLDSSNHYVGNLGPGDLNVLPVGLKKTVGNTTVSIAVSSAVFYPSYASLTVYARVQIPQSPGQIFFGVQGIQLSYSGGIIGDGSLVLLGNIPISINGGDATLTLKGGMNMATGQAASLTYVTIDCNGFKAMGINATLAFPQSMIVPLNAAGDRDTTRQVTAPIQTIVNDWNDILVDVSIPSFEITALPGIGFNIQQATFDFSDDRNAPGAVYPSDYQSKYMTPGNPNLWRGVYVKSLQVLLPKAFAKGNDTTSRIGFAATNMLIDNNGLTGIFSATNVLSFDEGSASGWSFSVNQFSLALEANQLTGAGFAGWLGLPIAGKEDTLGYTATIDANNNYLLQVNPLKALHFDCWSAQATLLPSSYVQFKLVNGRFQPSACLTGSLSINAANNNGGDTSKSVVKFNGIQFQNLRLQTVAPYISVDYFGYNGTISMAGFPVSISNIGLTATNTTAAIGFGLNVNLMDGEFGGGATIKVVGAMTQQSGIMHWTYSELDLGAVSVKADFGAAFKINGTVNILENDPTYGNAIGGSLNATFVNEVNVQASAIFGSKSYRYWYVDANAGFPAIPVGGIFALTGLGGGASYNMSKTGNPIPTGAGATSFRSYRPDSTYGLGLQAAILFASTDGHVLNGQASFTVEFNHSGGINMMGFYGYAKFIDNIPGISDVSSFMGSLNDQIQGAEAAYTQNNPTLVSQLATLKQVDPTSAAAIELPTKNPGTDVGLSAYMGIQYDFTTSTLDANFNVYVNAAGGMLVGTASQNRAGWAVFHVSPTEWYFNMGTPTDRLGVKFVLGGLSISTGTYLMVGDNLPGSPPPPQQVADILGTDLQSLDYMRDLNALGSGQGFAFGTDVTVSTGDITFLILYANFSAGVGFDVMLKNYGSTHCVGSSGPIGMNGWYANGQAYVYLQGELGVKVNLLFIHTKIPIIQGAAAALLQAELPNPSWFSGYLGVQFDLLGGLVKGNMRMQITLGDQCTIAGAAGAPVALNVISSVTPANQSTQVDVFAAPQAAFNMAIGQPFNVEDSNGTETYRIRLDSFTVSAGGGTGASGGGTGTSGGGTGSGSGTGASGGGASGSGVIPGKLQWNSTNDAVTFYSTEVLPPNQTVNANVSVTFEQLNGSSWQTLYSDGQVVRESQQVSFTTGTAPDSIPLTNIEYAYPVVGQRNLYIGECARGYIKLNRGQSYLFQGNWRQEIHFAVGSGSPVIQAVTYDAGNQQLNFNLPTLQPSTGYSWALLSYPTGVDTTSASTASYQSTQVDSNNSYSVRSNQAANVSQAAAATTLLSYGFTTSQYATMATKINAWRLSVANVGRISSDLINLQPLVQPYEVFDLPEIQGTSYTNNQPLLQVSAVLIDPYYVQEIYPLLYQRYPLAGDLLITNRDTSIEGFPPVRALPVNPTYLAEVQAGIYNGYAQTSVPFIYDLPQTYKGDFTDLQNQVVNKTLGTPEQALYDYIIMGYYPFISTGNYEVKYQYVLPDGTPGSTAVFNYPNPI